MLKKVAIGVGIVAALLLLAGVATALLVDVNSYKPTIERMVSDATGRKLTIDGPLSLRLFPRLGVALPKSTLSEQGSDRAFASFSSASVVVAWLPLLRGGIVIDQVSINGLQATVERKADGRTSIDDLLRRRQDVPEAKGDTSESKATSVSIRGIALNDAQSDITFCRRQHDHAIEVGSDSRRPRRRRLQAGSSVYIGDVDQAGAGCRPAVGC